MLPLRASTLALLALALAPAAPAAVPPLGQGTPVAIATAYDLPSAVLGETRRVNVWLPWSYGSGDARYPVLFVLDGGEKEDFHHISGLAQIGSMNGSLRELIVVGIANVDRRRDFTWPSRDPQDREDVPTQGGSAKFRQFVGSELIPWVEAHWRTTGERAILGESLAGLFVVDTLVRQPELFDTYLAISPSLWWDGYSLTAGAGELTRGKAYAGRRLYLAVGDEGPRMGVQGFADWLAAAAPAGLDWRFVPFTAETHATVYHPAAQAGLRALLLPPPAPAPAAAAPTPGQ